MCSDNYAHAADLTLADRVLEKTGVDVGRCNVGKYLVCKDGPVFTFAQLQDMPQEY